MERWPLGAIDDNRFELLGAEDGTAAVRSRVIVIIAEHRRVHQILARGTDAHHLGIFDSNFVPE